MSHENQKSAKADEGPDRDIGNRETGFFIVRLAQLTPSPADAAGAIRIAYAAGRRDESAARSLSLVRWRCAAGVLLGATVGLAAVVAFQDARPVGLPAGPNSLLARDNRPALPRDGRPDERWTAPSDPWALRRPPLRVLPGSYAALRAAESLGDGLPPIPPEPYGGPGPLPDDRPMTARGAV